MPQAITTLDAGTSVWVDEYIDSVQTPTEYIYLGTSSTGTAVLLRKEAAVQKRMHSENIGSYRECEADLWLENEETGFLSRFNEATRNALESTEIKYADGVDGTVLSIARRCYLLSYTECGFATEPDEGTSYLSALMTANNTTAASAARVCYNSASTAVYWWLRSASSSAQFRHVYTNGDAGTYNAAYTSNWVRPALSVAAATLVSDGTEETIYLLPDENKTYREASATVIIGTSAKRPKEAKLVVDVQNATETKFEVSNNAGDAEPVWVELENGGASIALENTAKETDNWTLGVKMYAKSGGKAKIGEPILVVLTDAEEA